MLRSRLSKPISLRRLQRKTYRKSRLLTIFLNLLGSGAWICRLGAWICQFGVWNCQLGVWNGLLGVWNCLLGVWTCLLGVWNCLWVSGIVFGCLDLSFGWPIALRRLQRPIIERDEDSDKKRTMLRKKH